MPEGHTIHRYARAHTDALGGRRVAASSPQGRFSLGAQRLDGRVLERVDAYGKHLLYRFTGGVTLHVHLGLFGHFRLFTGEAPAPTTGTRLALRAGDVTLYLAGATVCELIDEDEEYKLRARLGPDLLVADADPEQMWAALQRRTVGIGGALLDQRVVAGVGNVYRAEALFCCGIWPDRPANALDRDEFDQLWKTLVRMLADGERTGEIVTVDSPEGPNRSDALWVYKRGGEPCRRCGTTIESWSLGGRIISACPTCQPA